MKLFKSYSEKEVKKVRPIVDKINSLEEEISKLSDQELTKKTAYFKEELKTNYKFYIVYVVLLSLLFINFKGSTLKKVNFSSKTHFFNCKIHYFHTLFYTLLQVFC